MCTGDDRYLKINFSCFFTFFCIVGVLCTLAKDLNHPWSPFGGNIDHLGSQEAADVSFS